MSWLHGPLRLAFRGMFGRRLPLRDGSVHVSGPAGEIEIARDEYGIPYIAASTTPDVWFGLGFCQGQDRSFQIDTLVRAGRGRLAEISGEDMIPVDRLARRIGFIRSARNQLELVSERTRTVIDAFAEGVRTGRSKGRATRAHGFALTGVDPIPFDPADVFSILKVTSFTLPTNWDAELARLLILSEDGPEALRELDPVYAGEGGVGDQPEAFPAEVLSGRTIERLEREIEWYRERVSLGGGSNAWTVDGGRSGTGRPLLANDPHLAPQLPAHWYLARCQGPEWTAVGATMVGVPAIASGHNGHLAWGLTAGMIDNTDLFLEKLDEVDEAKSDGSVRSGTRTRLDKIEVRGGSSVREVVRETDRGPVISPILEDEPFALSMRATWLEPVPVGPFHRVPEARTVEEFRSAFRDWPFLSLNMVYAHEDGSIGSQLVGAAPRRRRGNGVLPAPGWEEDAGWEERFVTTDELPGTQNPSDSLVVAANDRPTDDDTPYLGWDWLDGYRARRIGEKLRGREDWTPGDFRGLQLDRKTLVWNDVRTPILGLSVTSREARLALDLLEEWDGVASADSAAAAVFELFIVEMSVRVVRARAPGSARWALGEGFHPMLPHTILAVRRVGHLARLIVRQPEGWFEGSWAEEMEAALIQAVRRIRDRAGPRPEDWHWGRLRRLTLEHPVGRQWPLNHVYDRGPFACGGDSNTIAQASVYPGDPFGDPIFVPSLRTVVDVGDWDRSRFVLPGGQSENPCSPHYDDQLALWIDGAAVRIPYERETAVERARHRLTLHPE